MNKKDAAVFVIHVCIPLILGGFIYYWMSPQVFFVKYADSILNIKNHSSVFDIRNPVLCFLRYYFLDMLWAYALVFALFFIYDNNTSSIKKIFVIAFSFSTIMELLQITPMISGTFDMLDIMYELLAEIAAVFIIKNILYGRNKK